MNAQEVQQAQERVVQLVRDYFEEPPDWWERVAEVGVVGLTVEFRYKNGSTSVGHYCSDPRYWVRAGIFRAAAFSVEYDHWHSEPYEEEDEDYEEG